MSSDADIRSRVIAVVTKEAMIDAEKLSEEALLADLNIDSIDMVMMLQGLEEEFGIYIPVEKSMAELKSVGDLLAFIENQIKAKG